MLSRRMLLGAAAASPMLVKAAETAPSQTPAMELQSMTKDAKPISVEELQARITKAQRLMTDQKIGAMLIESGSTLEYFTGVMWRRSERTTAAILPAKGEVIIVTPAFEEPSVRESLRVGGDVRPWNEHESPFERIVQGLKDRGAGSGKLAVEPTIRFFIMENVRKLGKFEIVSGDDIVRACRLIKSPAELALMQAANSVTLAAMKYVHDNLKLGMKPGEIQAMMSRATTALGGRSDGGGLVLLNEASAYPHGSAQPQEVREGSTILMDCGCTVHGYVSDISRTWIWGEPSAKQRKLWNTVKRGQEITLETAKLGLPCGKVDDAVRAYYEKEGWGPGYKLPGTPHRTGHGIGMDGHEPSYLVHGDTTPLQAGMCFSDEPGIYIPGEFGIRLEDCWTMTEQGPKLFTPLAKSIDQVF